MNADFSLSEELEKERRRSEENQIPPGYARMKARGEDINYHTSHELPEKPTLVDTVLGDTMINAFDCGEIHVQARHIGQKVTLDWLLPDQDLLLVSDVSKTRFRKVLYEQWTARWAGDVRHERCDRGTTTDGVEYPIRKCYEITLETGLHKESPWLRFQPATTLTSAGMQILKALVERSAKGERIVQAIKELVPQQQWEDVFIGLKIVLMDVGSIRIERRGVKLTPGQLVQLVHTATI